MEETDHRTLRLLAGGRIPSCRDDEFREKIFGQPPEGYPTVCNHSIWIQRILAGGRIPGCRNDDFRKKVLRN